MRKTSKMLLSIILGISFMACSSRDNDPETPTQPQNPIVNTNPNIDTNTIVNQQLSVPYFNSERNLNIKLYGQLFAPQGYDATKLPIVILAPGFSNNLEFMSSRYADKIARLGFVVYSFDFYGAYNGSRSGGSMTEMSPFTQSDDLNAVIQYFENQNYIDRNNIFLMGYSQGGVVSTLSGLAHKDKIKGLILMNAAFVLFDDAKATFSDVSQIPLIVNFRGATLGRIYFEKSLSYDIYQTIPAFDKKVIIFQGTNDNVVPLRYAQRAAQTFPNAVLHEIQGAGHIFSTNQDNALFGNIQQFLLSNIN